MLTLYHAPRSRSSRFIWLLEELGAAYDIRYVSIVRGDASGAADPDNPNPDKRVPTLVHDGALITESAAIALYLTDLFPSARIGPVIGAPDRGPYLAWLAYYAGVIEPLVVAKFNGAADQAWAVRAWGAPSAMEQRILTALKAGPYMLGEHFSAADILVASMGQFSRELLPAEALVDQYLSRTTSRPAAVRAQDRDAPKP